MDFYDLTSKWIMQIVQNCISDMAVWRSFTNAVIFYLNIGDLGLHFCGFNYAFLLYSSKYQSNMVMNLDFHFIYVVLISFT
ncbi:hypothetical protein AMTRI_Chr07g29040 [Amborella trichopoda]